MKIEYKQTEKEYPYLAYWTFGDPDNSPFREEDIVVISKREEKIWVQSLFGFQTSGFTKNEHEYTALPKGYQITITQ